jgi:hypothetical protein
MCQDCPLQRLATTNHKQNESKIMKKQIQTKTRSRPRGGITRTIEEAQPLIRWLESELDLNRPSHHRGLLALKRLLVLAKSRGQK